jgi:GT2 family glycosyltransferase
MKPLVSIVVVSHDHREYLKNCLSSVLAQTGVSLEVILVENASQDGTHAYIKQHFPTVKIIQRDRRRGFAANVNCGIKKSKGKYILILNPDTHLYSGTIEALVKRMHSNKMIGICGPKLVNPDGSTQMSYRNFPTWKTALFRRTPLRLLLPHARVISNHLNLMKDHSLAQPVDWMLGACLMFRRTMLKDVGVLDEGYRLYVEDIDICLRAHRAGWQVWYEPSAMVMHKHEAKSDRSLFSIHSCLHARSMMRYVAKYGIGSIK